MPPVYDQLQTSSCVGNAVAACLQFERLRLGLPEGQRVPSRLMLYYGAREIEGTVDSDAGSEIRDCVKVAASQGVTFEDGPYSWPFDPRNVLLKPPRDRYDHAFHDPATVRYLAVSQTAQQLRACLADGWPVAFGFTCYAGLDSKEIATNDRNAAQSGRLVMPQLGEQPLGGHAVVLAGYDNPNRTFLVRNSWSTAWGLRGYFMMPYEYVLRADLSSDFWTVRLEN